MQIQMRLLSLCTTPVWRMSEQMQLAYSTPQPSFRFTPRSWIISPHPNARIHKPHPNARIHKPLFQSPHSINRNRQHIPPVELPLAGMTLGIYLSVGRNTSLWIGRLVLPVVVLIVATRTRPSCPGCTSSITTILWIGRLVLPVVVLIVATCTRPSCPGCTSSITAILWIGCLVLPVVVLIVATCTRPSRSGCISSTTAILQAWGGRMLSLTKAAIPGCRFGWVEAHFPQLQIVKIVCRSPFSIKVAGSMASAATWTHD